jgi:nucleotide-binding universal stress UspA family protein
VTPRSKIVCAVDRSERSREAVEAARWLAQALGVEVVVAHAFDPMAVPVPPVHELSASSTRSDDFVRAERQAAQVLLRDLSAQLAQVGHTSELIEGGPAAGMLDLVHRHRAELLVTGTAARSKLDRLLIGSVATELACKAACPVVCVPPGARVGDPGPVVVAWDGSDGGERAAHHARALATRIGRELVAVNVVEGGAPEGAGPEGAEVVVEHGDPVAAIARVARSREAALVVSGTRRRGALKSALVGSVSAGLVREAGRPVMLVSPVASAD